MVGINGIDQNRDTVSIWSVIIPIEIDRAKYIKTCYQTGTVSLTNGNEFVHKVKIGKLTIQSVIFPLDNETFGSEVICLTSPYSGKLYVTDVYATSTELNDQQENQYRFFKFEDGYAEIRIDGQGKIAMSVDGSDDQSEVCINVTSENKKGKLKLNVNGDIIVQNQGNTTLSSSNNIKVGHKKADSETYINIKEKEVRIISEGKIYLNESEEPMLLGTKVTDFLSDLLDQLGKESAGPYPLLGNSSYISMKNKLEELKSKLSFVK